LSEIDYEVTDTHCHLDFKNFNKDREETIQRALDAGVTTMIDSGVELKSNKRALKLARNYDFIHATLGMNPNPLTDMTDQDVQSTLDHIRENAGEIVAVGEAGLDHYRCLDPAERERQVEVFKKVIDLTQELDLPLTIHARDTE